ncbi:unnamed protein product [Schistosoma guineensis]|nr:unnamed protein product [Schistosoma guineensis]
MEPAMEKLDIHSTPEAIEDYLERFEIWSMTKKDVKGEKIVAHFLTFIGREVYSLLKTLAYPEKPISLPYATLKELLLSHVKCTSFECRERAKFHKMVRQNDQKVREFILELQKQAAKCNFGDQLHVQLRDRLIAGINIPSLERELLRMPNCSFQDARTACINYEAVNELDIQSMNISNTLLSRRDELQSQGQSNLRSFNSDSYSRVNMKGVSTRNYKANHKDESSSILTTINTPFGLFKYNFLPFGLSCSPAIFQEVMNTVVSDLEGVEVYQDDLIVHGSNKVVHDQRLIALLRRLIEKNITVNPNKCSFCVSSFECLGYLVDGNGFRPDMKRLAPLTNAPSPKNLTELRSLVGALQYYSRFIPNFSCRANCLFNILTSNSFKWSEEQESCLRSLLKFLQSDAVLRTYSPNVHSVLITDASPVGIGAVLEQEGRPVICVSRKLTVTEQGYSQTQREALAVFWAVKRLHKYLFGKKFTIVTDHEALKFIYHPGKSLARSSAAMVQRWSIALSAYDYTVQHRSAKQIQHVDYISRQSLQDKPINTSDCLLVQPLPVRRSDLIRETRRYFGCILSAIRKGWNANLKRRFPIYFSKRDELSTTPDGILCLNDRVVIPPSLRKSVLEDLHSGHLGVEKMKSLARLTCWWPEINADICRTANNCEKCHQLKNHPSKWVPWPVSSEAWQRIHADYCGPFLGKYYALVVIDSFSKWPEVFFTTSPNSDFTIQALRKVFSREGVPLVLVTDNGSHFAADAVTTWLNGIGCKHLFTAPRHPCSNGQAENFVRTLKTAIDSIAPSTFNELERGVDTFLLQYRNAKHSVTKETPAKLLKGRILRSNMRCLESAEVTYYRGNDLRPSTGIVLKNVGKSMVRILDIDDLSTHSRHVDQIQFQEPGESVPISIVNSNANEHILDNTESLSNTMSDRLRMNLRRRRTIDYKHLDSNLSCGGCGV